MQNKWGAVSMRTCLSITGLFLAFSSLGGGLVAAADMGLPPKPIPVEEAVGLPAEPAAPAPLPPVPLLPPMTVQGEAPGPAIPDEGYQREDLPGLLTRDDLEQIALESNPTLVQARMAVRAAQGGYVQAGLYPNPAIAYAGGDLGIEGTAGQQGMVIGQEIVTWGKRRLERAVASHEVQEAQHAWESQRQRVLNDVGTSFYEVLLAQKMIETNQQMVRIGEESAKAAEQLRAAMEVSRADVLQARIEAEMAAVNLNTAENRHRAAWRRLVGLLGRPDMQPADLAGDVDEGLPQLEWEESLARLMSESPELAHARSAVERARCNLALQQAERLPNLEVEVGAKYDDSTYEALADVGLGVELPLFNRNQGNIVTAEAELIAAEHEVRRVELDLRDRLVEAFEQYANARWQVDAYKNTILPNSQASLEMVGAGYREGELGYLTLLTAQRTYFSVNLEYLASLGQLWADSVGIEGMLLSGGLGGPE